MSATRVEWILAAVEDDLADAWTAACGGLPGVRVHRGSILDAGCDAVVSPANSFGFMRGGIDAVYARTFDGIESRVRAQIAQHHGGELPVGSADIVETGHPRIPFLIAAPTMREPMVLPADTRNPYLAARARVPACAGRFGRFAGPVGRHPRVGDGHRRGPVHDVRAAGAGGVRGGRARLLSGAAGC